MHSITVVPLGPGHQDLVTMGALKQMRRARCLVRSRHGAVPMLEEEGIAFSSLDALHEESPDFDAFTMAAVDAVLMLAEDRAVTYAVPDPCGMKR